MARTPDDSLASLVKQLEKAVTDNAEKKLAVVINFIGEPTDEYQEQIAEFAEKNKVEKIALTVTGDAAKFNVGESSELTVMHYKGKQVKFNHSVDKGKLNADAVRAIISGLDTVLE